MLFLLSRGESHSAFIISFLSIYRNYAKNNRKEWESKGQGVVDGYVEKYRAKYDSLLQSEGVEEQVESTS